MQEIENAFKKLDPVEANSSWIAIAEEVFAVIPALVGELVAAHSSFSASISAVQNISAADYMTQREAELSRVKAQVSTSVTARVLRYLNSSELSSSTKNM